MTGPGAADDPRSEKLRRSERGIEDRLARLAEAGELSGLPGEGRPFPDRGPDQAGERWAAFRLMRNNAVLPDWAQLRREVEDEVVRLERLATTHRRWLERRRERAATLRAEALLDAARATRARDERFRAEIQGAVDELNLKVGRFNAVAPVPSLQLVPFRAGRFLEER